MRHVIVLLANATKNLLNAYTDFFTHRKGTYLETFVPLL